MQEINEIAPISINDLKNLEVTLSFSSVLLSMFLSAVCAYFIGNVYKKFSSTFGNKEALADTFWLLAVTTTLVITVVKFSLALSLGLVGALSIVRFRAAIKEPEELVYLFLVIAIGLAMGANQFLAGISLTLFAYVFIIIFSKVKKRKIITSSTNFKVISSEGDVKSLQYFKEFLGGYPHIETELISSSSNGEIYQISYLLKGEIPSDFEILISEFTSEKKIKINYGRQNYLPN